MKTIDMDAFHKHTGRDENDENWKKLNKLLEEVTKLTDVIKGVPGGFFVFMVGRAEPKGPGVTHIARTVSTNLPTDLLQDALDLKTNGGVKVGKDGSISGKTDIEIEVMALGKDGKITKAPSDKVSDILKALGRGEEPNPEDWNDEFANLPVPDKKDLN